MAEATTENSADVSKIRPTAKKVKLLTVDGTELEVEEAIALEFLTLKSIIEEDGISDTPIPLPNVLGSDLRKILEFYWQKNKGKYVEGDNNSFKQALVEDITNEDIKRLLAASNYLNANELLDFLCMCVADRIKDKSVEYVRAFFEIENDYSQEEEDALREQNAWAFEDIHDD